MSGAGRIKRDASDAENLVEIKDANKTYSISATDMKSLHHEASIQGKTPVIHIIFTNGYEVEGIVKKRPRQ